MVVRMVIILLLFCTLSARAGTPTWTNLWQGFQNHYMDTQGRVINPIDDGISTSEGQAYGLFFSLVADNRHLFQKILEWTQSNLAQGDLSRHLPIWRWGRAEDGHWGPLSKESASDADMWIAYTLFSAARLWHDPHYAQIAQELLGQISQHEVVELDGWGPILLPGDGTHWQVRDGFIVNPSYLPPFLLDGLGRQDPTGPWLAISRSLPHLLSLADPRGFAPDWFILEPHGGYAVAPRGPQGSYDAIRCYLWAGMTDPSHDSVAILHSLRGMAAIIASGGPVPEEVDTLNGKISGRGPPGFIAALLPYLQRFGDTSATKRLAGQLYAAWNPSQERFGPHYYDNALALFALGYVDGLYRFMKDGNLRVFWQNKSSE